MNKKIYPEFKAQEGTKIIPEPVIIPEGNKTPGIPLNTYQDTAGESHVALPGSNIIRIKSDGTLYMEDTSRLPIMSFESIKTGTLHADQTLTVGGSGATDWRVELSGGTSTFPIRYWNGTTVKFSLDDAGNVVISGSISASSIHIPNAAAGADSFHVDTTGNVWWNSVTLAAAVTYIKKNGIARFNNDVEIGDWAAGQGAKWDQSANLFSVLGDITANACSIGSGNNVFKADIGGIYLGNATFGLAPFRVNMSGDFVATKADIKGDIKADTGYFETGYLGGTADGWEISAGYLKSTSGDIELKGTTTSHIKALLDASNYVQMTSASGVPRVDLYNSGQLRARLSGIGLTFYDANGVSRGTITGNTGGYTNMDLSDLRISSGASEVRIWSDGVRVKLGKGFFCQDDTGSSYFSIFVDSVDPNHPAVLDMPDSDRIIFSDKASNPLLRLFGKTLYDNQGFIDMYVPFGLATRTTNPTSMPIGAMYFNTSGDVVRVYTASGWRSLAWA